MPLKSPRKKSRESADSDNDGTPFENMMNYMMFQNRMETEQREHQMKADKEDRDREYQLRHEEMVIQRQREDNRAQHNMMNRRTSTGTTTATAPSTPHRSGQ